MSEGVDLHTVLVAQQVLQQHLDRVRQSLDPEVAKGIGAQGEVGQRAALYIERGLGVERVE
jgi:hypothetical protein